MKFFILGFIAVSSWLNRHKIVEKTQRLYTRITKKEVK